MGTEKPFDPQKLIVGVLYSLPEIRDPLLKALEEAWGPLDYISAEWPFVWTRYYDAEMGAPIRRFFLSMRDLHPPDRLSEIKRTSNRLEDRFRSAGRRQVNLDPGFLSLSRLILATTKDSSHRIPLQGGIYAEVTLLFEHGGFRPVEWTYPDYRTPEYRETFLEIRRLYAAQLGKSPQDSNQRFTARLKPP